MEDHTIRVIYIGVSIFITMITLTAIMLYFNTSKELTEVVANRTDISESFDDIVNSDNYETTLSGVEIRSLITKYAGNQKVIINIVKIGDIVSVDYTNINNEWVNEIGIISEEKLDMIEPVWTNRVEKVENKDTTTLNIYLNV